MKCLQAEEICPLHRLDELYSRKQFRAELEKSKSGTNRSPIEIEKSRSVQQTERHLFRVSDSRRSQSGKTQVRIRFFWSSLQESVRSAVVYSFKVNTTVSISFFNKVDEFFRGVASSLDPIDCLYKQYWMNRLPSEIHEPVSASSSNLICYNYSIHNWINYILGLIKQKINSFVFLAFFLVVILHRFWIIQFQACHHEPNSHVSQPQQQQQQQQPQPQQ